MSLQVIRNSKPAKAKSTSILVSSVLFTLRKTHNIIIHKVTSSFYHIIRNGRVIGFSCHYLLAIDKAYSYLKQLPSESIRSLINTAYLDMQHKKASEVVYG